MPLKKENLSKSHCQKEHLLLELQDGIWCNENIVCPYCSVIAYCNHFFLRGIYTLAKMAEVIYSRKSIFNAIRLRIDYLVWTVDDTFKINRKTGHNLNAKELCSSLVTSATLALCISSLDGMHSSINAGTAHPVFFNDSYLPAMLYCSTCHIEAISSPNHH